MNAINQTQIIDAGDALELRWQNGAVHRYHAIWLRHNGCDEKSRDQDSGQKLLTINDIPRATVLQEACVRDGKLHLVFAPDDFATWIDADWLLRHAYDAAQEQNMFAFPVQTWTRESLGELANHDFDELKADARARFGWLREFVARGVARVCNLPTPQDPDANIVQPVIDLFGYTRETNYGKFFRVAHEANPINLAYTRRGLQAHTDNPYRDPAPGIQLLACIENSAGGGATTVADGFKCAEILRAESREHFTLLSEHSANFIFQGDATTDLRAQKPMLELTPEGKLCQVRFNSRSLDALTCVAFADMKNYFEAYRHFASIIERDDLQFRFRLRPRELFMVDNRRVLHGRDAFDAAGNRRLQGAYADMDSLTGALRVLAAQQN